MNTKDKSEELLKLFVELRKILANENDSNWIRGIDLIIAALSQIDKSEKKDFEETLDYVSETYKSMVSGNGSFADFYIWRDEFKERKKENEKLDVLRSDIWSLVS
ncbi:hypothetical protein [Enterovibrio sp. 27052020O]|uniref:hypothetical protein n=1 Tax=Enterovibrio sp. 27052020O TaxID=3241166 RepID=UPI00388F7D2F